MKGRALQTAANRVESLASPSTLCRLEQRAGLDGAHHARAILSFPVKARRARWPKVEIIFRGDSGFCRWRMLRWCENQGVRYVVGIARNKRLRGKASALIEKAGRDYRAARKQQRLFGPVYYGARTWDRARRVIAKAERTALGANPRFVATNLTQTG